MLNNAKVLLTLVVCIPITFTALAQENSIRRKAIEYKLARDREEKGPLEKEQKTIGMQDVIPVYEDVPEIPLVANSIPNKIRRVVVLTSPGVKTGLPEIRRDTPVILLGTPTGKISVHVPPYMIPEEDSAKESVISETVNTVVEIEEKQAFINVVPRELDLPEVAKAAIIKDCDLKVEAYKDAYDKDPSSKYNAWQYKNWLNRCTKESKQRLIAKARKQHPEK